MDRTSFRLHAATAAATAIALIPGTLSAQEFIWDITPDATVVGGSGVLDQGVTPNFQSPTGVPNQTFPGNAPIAFTAAAPGTNTVTVDGTVAVTGLRFDVGGYALTGGVGDTLVLAAPVVGLQLNNNADIAVSAALSGALAVDGGGTLNLAGDQGDLTDLSVGVGIELLSSADVAGDLSNDGATTNEGRFGSVTNTGAFIQTASGVVDGDATNASTGLMLLAGEIALTLVNDEGTVDMTDDLDIGGNLINAGGTVTINNGQTSVGSDLLNSGTMVISDTANVTGQTVNQTNGFLQIDGVLQSDARLEIGSETWLSGEILGDVDNQGTLAGFGLAEIEGNLINANTVDMTQSIGAGDVLRITGDLSGTGDYVLDLDLSGAGSGDRIEVEGTTTGNINLSFNILENADIATQQNILVFDVNDAAANSFSFTASGLPANDGIRVYSVQQDGANGDLFVIGQINPGVGSVGGNLVLTQSLIGAIVNRPTSPFVVGLAYDDPDPCGAGAWSRLQAGQADASPGSDNGVSQVQSTVSADYTGFQAGGDFACFRGPDGWDLAIGAIGGVNDGQIEQPVFAIDPLDATALTDTLTSVTTTDFMQRYLGIYGTASTGPWSADLQFRLEETDFDITNEGVNGMDGIGVEGAELTSDARTLSGAVNYAYAIPDTDFALIPTAGLAITRGSSGSVDFADGSRLDIGDFASDVGFVGVTGAWSRIDNDSQGALRAFLTTTYYNDFSDPIASVFTTPTNDSAEVENETLGSYGEVSVGASYVRLAPVDSFAGVKQYVGSLRADARFGDQIDSWGLVGQVRVQF